MLRRTAGGFGALGLQALLAQDSGLLAGSAPHNPLAPKLPHFSPRAKRVIFVFMHGGPSQVDTFDPKPRLDTDHGKPIPFKLSLQFSTEDLGGLMKSPFAFRHYGESGIPVSDLFRHVGAHADELCVIRSMVGEGVDHGAALLQLNTGTLNFTLPSMGSWIFYGLGTENQNLPGYIEIKPSYYHGGARNWHSGFLPGAYQGTPIGNDTDKVADIRDNPIEHLTSGSMTSAQQRYELEMLQKINRRNALDNDFDPKLEARIQSFELAFRMQMDAPEILEIKGESEATRKLYGLDDPVAGTFGRQCLMARRMVERGVRFVKLLHGKGKPWDQHGDLAGRLPVLCHEVDQPIAGLLKDLKSRGMLEETLVVWASEMGRTPFDSNVVSDKPGRDHNRFGLVMWMAGGDVRPGATFGQTDEFALRSAGESLPVRDVHATLLRLMGLDQHQLTVLHAGRFKRLTDIGGRVIDEILL